MKNKYKLFNLILITIALVGFGPVEASLYQDDENSNGNSSQEKSNGCLLYTSPSPRDYAASRMPSSA